MDWTAIALVVVGALAGAVTTVPMALYAERNRRRDERVKSAAARAQQRRGTVDYFIGEIQAYWSVQHEEYFRPDDDNPPVEERVRRHVRVEKYGILAETALFRLRLDCPELDEAGTELLDVAIRDGDWSGGMKDFADAARAVLA